MYSAFIYFFDRIRDLIETWTPVIINFSLMDIYQFKSDGRVEQKESTTSRTLIITTEDSKRVYNDLTVLRPSI